MRAVLDASVVVSAALSPDGPSGRLVRAALEGAFDVVTSREVFGEAAQAVERAIGIDPTVAMTLLREISAVVALPDEIPRVARDRDDDKVVATAITGDAEYIVTNDHDLLALNREDLPFACIEPQRLLELLDYLQ